jgi:hypothetical protein
MDVVIETDRMLLRMFTKQDAPLLYELNLGSEVTRYTHDLMKDHFDAKKVLDEVILPQYERYNHGAGQYIKSRLLNSKGGAA